MEKTLNIFFASNEDYIPFTATAIFSILENTNEHIHFYILDENINVKSKDKLFKMKEMFNNVDLEFVSMKKYNLKQFPKMRHYSTSAFSRYFIPKLFPHLDRALYLDSDIIVAGDIKALYYADLNNYPIGAILEDFYPENSEYLKENIYKSWNSGNQYFNSGVLLMDIQKLNEMNATDKLVNLTLKYRNKISTADQDIYNILFENNYKSLSYRFNFSPAHWSKLFKIKPNEAIDVLENYLIIHYASTKPWNDTNIALANKFWEIAEKTLFYKRIKKINYKNNHKREVIKLFGFIPIFVVESTLDFKKSTYYLLNFLPVLKVRRHEYE